MQKQSRIRYSLWMALSDVGGLTDGIYVVIGLVFTPIAAAYFERDLVKDSLFEPSSPSRRKQGRIQLAHALD